MLQRLGSTILDWFALGPYYRMSLQRRHWLASGVIALAMAAPVVRAGGPAGSLFFPSVEERAVLGLRTLGSAQLAYQDANLNKDYARLGNLWIHGQLQEDDLDARFLASYELQVHMQESLQIGCGADSSFTAVAYPRSRRLRTFAICDDQTVRQFAGNGDVLPCRWPAVDWRTMNRVEREEERRRLATLGRKRAR